MTVDLDSLYRVLAIVSALISIGAAVFAWLATRRKDVDRRFQEGSKRMDRHDLRLQALEQDVKAMPGSVDMHRLELSLSEMAGDMKAMAASMQAMAKSQERAENIISRHEEHLRGTSQ